MRSCWIVDDGGYGILREYQRDAFGETTAVELPGKDLVAVAAAYGVPAAEPSPTIWASSCVGILAGRAGRRRAAGTADGGGPDAVNPDPVNPDAVDRDAADSEAIDRGAIDLPQLLRRSVLGAGPYVPGAGARELKARTGAPT